MAGRTRKSTIAGAVGAVEYGQLAVLIPPGILSPSIASQIYQWRTYHGVIEDTLNDWVQQMGIPADEAAAILAVDPILAALNHLAADGWTLVYVEDVEPGKLTYDRCQGDKPYVKARWWLMRQCAAAAGRDTPRRASQRKATGKAKAGKGTAAGKAKRKA